MSPEEIIDIYGDDFLKGNHLGTEYLIYINPITSKTNGDYIQQKIMFFQDQPNAEPTCFMFYLLEPVSEIKINRDIYNRDFIKLKNDHWYDPETEINYSIEELNEHCLITAWVGERKENFDHLF